MPGLLIKDFSPVLHRRLKEEAERHHRSMNRQALALLEQALTAPPRNTAGLLPDQIRPSKLLSSDDVVNIIREHRDADRSNLPE